MGNVLPYTTQSRGEGERREKAKVSELVRTAILNEGGSC